MGLLKHNRETKTTQHWLRKHLGFLKTREKASDSNHVTDEQSRHTSTDPVLDSRPPSNQKDSPTSRSLWDRAYDALRDNEPSLANEYDELLLKEAQKTDFASNGEVLADVDRAADKKPHQAQLESIIAMGLQRMEDRKIRYTIAGHEFILTDQIAQASQLVLWAKSWIDEAVKQSPQASLAWAGVCVILPLLINPTIARKANSDGFAYVTTRMRYYTELEPLFQRVSRNPEVTRALIAEAENSIVDLYHYILEFQIRSILRFYENALKRYVKDMPGTVDWDKKRLDIEKLESIANANLGQITQLAAREELDSINNTSKEALVAMLQFLSVSKNQLLVIEEHRDIAKKYLKIQEDNVKEKLSGKEKKCHQLFRLTSSDKDATYEWYKNRVEDRVHGTCEWFLKHKNFQTWLEQDSGPLLVSADPGCGKSVLAKYLIDHRLPRSSTICYFFFKDQDQNTSRQALCALLHQLFSQKPSLIAHATREYDKNGRGLIYSTSSLWAILHNALQDPQAGPIIIVLDALDECVEREFRDLIHNVESQFNRNQSNRGKVKYLLTSRPYEQIVSNFQRLLATFPYVRIPGEEESETISQEVNHVIEYRVEKLAIEKELSDQVKRHLADKLLAIPHRTYLWVYLVFDYLRKEDFKKTAKGVDSTMATLPKTINQAYEQILSKSKEDPMVRKALSIILVANRPLAVSEMNIALSVNETTKTIHDLDLEEEKDFKLRLRSWCGLFVSIYHKKIYFIHQTAREFLLGPPPAVAAPPASEVCWQYSFISHHAHMVLAEVCVVYLSFLNYDACRTDENKEKGQSLYNIRLLHYAAINWGAHFRQACVGENDNIVYSALGICRPCSGSCSAWFKIYWQHTTNYGRIKKLTSLFILSYLGLESAVKVFLENGANLDTKDDYSRTPLSWAAEQGHEIVVKLLIDKGANLEKRDAYNQTPLSLAAEQGHEAVVKLLLENGANLQTRDIYNRTPLSWAAEKGHEAVVKLLIEKGVDIETRDKFKKTPLSWAAEEGHEAVVKLLLGKRALPGDLTSKSAEVSEEEVTE